jgi:ATP-dependent DNA helicase RecG
MNLNQLKNDISLGEGLHCEFKEARDQLPRNLFESIAAFLNTDGGIIFLGVGDDGSITGVDPSAVDSMKAELASLSNNPQKIDPPYLLFPQTFEIEGKMVIAAQVPLNSQLHKTRGEIYLRSEDGDYRVQGTYLLAGLINRKLGLFTEQRTQRFVTIDDLRPELFDHARRLMRGYNSQHPWANLSNEELLQFGGFYSTDLETGQRGLTLGALLLFGNDTAIQEAVPAFKFDCLLRRENVDRYDDRLTIRTNLIDAYDQMMGFVAKHLNDPFFLEGDLRISLRDKIFREAISNIISHREYTSAAPARLIIYKNRVLLDNPCTQHHFGEITPENLRPFSKNPSICKFMIQLGRFDELGSGVTNIYKYLPHYTPGATPDFKETTHGFELSIPLVLATPEATGEVAGEVASEVIAVLAALNTPLSRSDLQEALGLKSQAHFRDHYLNPALDGDWIERTQPDAPKSPTQKYRLTQQGQLVAKQ